MRKRDEIEGKAFILDDEPATNDAIEFVHDDEPGNGKSANGNNESRTQDLQLIVHPGRTIRNLLRRWHAIGPAGCFSGKTTDDSSEVDSRTHRRFIHCAPLFKPAK